MTRIIIAVVVGGMIAAIITTLWHTRYKHTNPADPKIKQSLQQMRNRMQDLQIQIDAILLALPQKETVHFRSAENRDMPEIGEDLSKLAHPAAELLQHGYRRVSPRALEEAGLNAGDARLTAELINGTYVDREDAIRVYEEQYSKVESDVRVLLVEHQLGEHVYDSYLYATAQRNRLKLIGVAEGSAAQQGGVLAGDFIYSLDGDRVFGPGDVAALQSLHQSSEELIELIVEREGAFLSTYVPRGNLGIRFSSVRVRPVSK
jgi:hypothetical protein